jgi:two-component system LytT family sensor kinase
MKKYKHLIIVLLLSLIIGLLLFLYISYSLTGQFPDFEHESLIFQFSVLTTLLIGLVFYFTTHKLNKILPWDKNFVSRILTSIIINMVFAIIITAAMFYFYLNIFVKPHSYLQYLSNYQDGILKTLILLFVFTFTITVVEFLYYSYRQYAVLQIESIQLTREKLELQYKLLKSQLSPHFLFNSLNTISSLVYRDVRIAEKFIREFASTYHYILSTHQKNLVSIKEELCFVKAYGYILQTRFENALEIYYNVPPELYESKIPPFSLQLLVENAVKHNLIAEEQPLKIEIFFENNEYLVVRNNFIGKPYYVKIKNKLYKKPTERSYKIGLDNIEKRYSYFTNKKMQIIKDGYFTVKLPILN